MKRDKQCSACRIRYPATKEYFHAYDRSGSLKSRCKTCHNAWIKKKKDAKKKENYDKLYEGDWLNGGDAVYI
jgi:hypothetical protein